MQIWNLKISYSFKQKELHNCLLEQHLHIQLLNYFFCMKRDENYLLVDMVVTDQYKE